MEVKPKDREFYYQIKKETCEKYVNKFLGGWDEIEQRKYMPNNLVEGLLVGRKHEKDKRALKHIKEKFPNAYICNLDGKVIVE